MKVISLSAAILVGVASARADVILDLSSVTPGGAGAGAFSGTLGSVAVSGTIDAPSLFFSFNDNAPDTGISDSTTDGDSPQYSYSSIYTPSFTGDRVGWSYAGGGTGLVRITFTPAVTDPVLHWANVDDAQLEFAATVPFGLTSLTLLSGNGDGSSDGLAVVGTQIRDINPVTTDATLPTSTPPTTGARSAYGSVRLNGTISEIHLAVGSLGNPPDDNGGSFSISAVPEASSLLLVGLGALSFIGTAMIARAKARTMKPFRG
jgi:hypothetical protein